MAEKIVPPIYVSQGKASNVSKRMHAMFGVTQQSLTLGRGDNKHTLFEIEMQKAYSVSLKMAAVGIFAAAHRSFEEKKDSSGKKWKPLSRRTLRNRVSRGNMSKDILIDTGGLNYIATGGNMNVKASVEKLGGPGSTWKPGIRLDIRHNYRLGEAVQAATTTIKYSGDKTKHNYGYTQKFDVYVPGGKGKKVSANVTIPARPWLPKMTPYFLKKWQQSTNKRIKNVVEMSPSITRVGAEAAMVMPNTRVTKSRMGGVSTAKALPNAGLRATRKR